MNVPKINKQKCIGCKLCVDTCPMDAIQLLDGKAEIDPDTCFNCRVCISACPEGAIS
jgi:ferredoxin